MDVEYRGRAAYLPAVDSLVLADLHVGRLAASNVEAPVASHDGLVERLADHLDEFDPATVVVAGDVLHVHGSVPTGAKSVLDEIVTCVEERDATMVLVRGNHDTILDALDVGSADTEVVDEYRLGDGTLVCHGHEEPAERAERYVIGHEHPAIRIEGARHACFLRADGAYEGGDVHVLPAFSQSATGTLVNGRRSAMSPLVGALGRFRPVVVGEETYEFPPLSKLGALL